MTDVSAADAITLAIEGGWVLDVREPDEWMCGHSPIAHSVPMSQLNERVGELPTDQQILVVCHSGSRSLRASDALRQAGFDSANVVGGMIAWHQAGGEIVADGNEPARVD